MYSVKHKEPMMKVINNSLKINNVHNYQTLKLLINIISVFSALVAIIISIFIIDYLLIKLLRKNNLKKSTNISLLLTCNTCIALICSSSTLTLMILSSIGGDLNIYSLKTIIHTGCHLRGYLHFVFINSIYLSYVLQAGFRLFRIAFHEYKCLRTIYSFSFYIFIQWMISFLLILPILIGDNRYSSLIVYLPEEYYCQVPITSIRGIIFSILSVYFLPLCCISIIYLWIIIHIRRKNRPYISIILSLHRQNKRDTIIIKRLCIVITTLLLLGIPSCLFVIAFIITGHLHWASYRIGWMTISIAFALISLSSVYVTPQIYEPIRIMINHSKENKRTRSSSSSTCNNIQTQRKIQHFVFQTKYDN